MDNSILKKRLNTFKSSKGSLTRISNEVIIDVLRAWEQWPGTTADFYRDLDIKKGQCSSIIKKAKQLIKSGAYTESEFKEIDVVEQVQSCSSPGQCNIELIWQNNVIRFGSSDLLLDFLKKAA